MGRVTKSSELRFIAKAEDRRLVTGIVYEPNKIDLQDDYADAETIEQAAHEYMRESRAVEIMHDGQRASVEIVESYIAPVDFNLPDGQLIRKGTWVAVMKVGDNAVWARIKSGELKGLSMGGWAEREEAA